MSSSVFSETPSARPSGADGDSNLVVVYSKNGISFDERAIENIMGMPHLKSKRIQFLKEIYNFRGEIYIEHKRCAINITDAEYG